MTALALSGAFEQPYMQRAMVVIAVIAVLGAIVGTHVVLRRLTFLTEALQHTVLPGVAAAFVAGESLLLGAALAAVATVVVHHLLERSREIDRDSLLALTVTVFLGIGVAIVSTSGGFQRDLTGLLFGRVLSTDGAQVVETLAVASVVLVAVFVLRRQLVFGAFDPMGAAAAGFNVRACDVALNICVALTVVVSIRTLGTVLVLAFVVTPVIAARTVVSRIRFVTLVAAGLAITAGIAALVLGYELSVSQGIDVPAGALVVLTVTAALIITSAAAGLVRVVRAR